MSDLISLEEAIKDMRKIEYDDIEMYGGVSIPEGFNSDPAVEALNSLDRIMAVPIEDIISFLADYFGVSTDYLLGRAKK